MPTLFGDNILIDGSSLQLQRAHPHLSLAHAPAACLSACSAASQFESEVRDLLLGITMFSTGQAVIDEIWRQHHGLRIVPRKARRPWDDDNMFTASRPFMGPDQVQFDERNQSHPEDDQSADGGFTATIRYSPQTSIEDTRLHFMSRHWETFWLANTGIVPMAPGNDRAEVLLHELVHGLAMMAGSETGFRPVPGRWDNEDEFRAILVTDIYASECGRAMRTSNTGEMPANSAGWSAKQDLQQLLDRFSKAQPGLVRRLRDIETPFNPFHESFQPACSAR